MPHNLEEVIHQNYFENPYLKILVGLMVVNSRMEERQNVILKRYDLSLQQYNVLRILRGQYPNYCTLLVIKERMIDRMSDVSRIVERLRKNRLLTREPKAEDRRAVDIRITDIGLDLLKRIDTEIDYFYEPIKKMPDEDVTQFAELLEKLLNQVIVSE